LIDIRVCDRDISKHDSEVTISTTRLTIVYTILTKAYVVSKRQSHNPTSIEPPHHA